MARMTIGRAEERPHHPRGTRDIESWRFDFASADGALGGWVRHTLRRDRERGRYEAFLTGEHRQLLVVVDDEVPRRSSPMEVRTTGLWADHVLETPLEHWTIGLEAFAVGLDEPLAAYGEPRGDQVPLGLDLEWEATGPALSIPRGVGVTAYEVPAEVHGEILIGSEAIDFAGVGWRSHEWGAVDWRFDDGWHVTGTGEGDRRWRVDCRESTLDGRLVHPDGQVIAFRPEGGVVVDDDGLPVEGWLDSDVLSVDFEVLAPTPVSLADQDHVVRRPAALVRHRLDGGGIGIGWVEVRGTSFARGALRSTR